MKQHRVAFYPCCGTDIATPIKLLHHVADEVIFCDIRSSLANVWRRVTSRKSGIQSEFMLGAAQDIVKQIPQINVLFYRRDSAGEGGSGVFVLGDKFLPLVLEKFPSTGGLIITDGSNSRGGNFKNMISETGLQKHGWHFSLSDDQSLRESHGLFSIEASHCGGNRRQVPSTS